MANGGRIGSRDVPGVDGYGGVWSLREVADARRKGVWVDQDLYWSNVVALLHFDGADGSTTFTDERGHAFTAAGSAQIDTAQSKFGGASGLFDGNGDYLTAPHSSDFTLTSGDWTIEAWIRINALSSGNMEIVEKDGQSGSYYMQYDLGVSSAGKLVGAIGSGSAAASYQVVTGATTITTGAWHHVAFTLSGTTLRVFLDGVQDASATKTVTMGDGGRDLYIGWQAGQPTSAFWNGWIDEVRITKGVARYTANFTPPTAQFPNG